MAALEIGRRRQDQAPVERPQIISSRDTYNIMYEHLADVPNEEFWVLFLNNANRVLDKTRLSVGSLSATLVDTRIIMKLALEKLATGIVLCHNHPSGNKTPSEQDHTLTARINAACKLLDIRLADHIIFTTDHGFYSFADEGEIKRIN